jgi:hypothetical protein
MGQDDLQKEIDQVKGLQRVCEVIIQFDGILNGLVVSHSTSSLLTTWLAPPRRVLTLK